MKYTYQNIELIKEPEEFNKDTGKEILQYALGGLLYMPANNQKIASKIISKDYAFIKSMVLDLEDSLGDDMVGFAHNNIKSTIEQLDEAVKEGKMVYEDIPLIFIRVRDKGQMSKTANMLKENIKYITGFNIPKFDRDCCDDYILEFTKVKDAVNKLFNYKHKIYMMPIIENKLAMYRQLRMENLLYISTIH